MAKATAALSIRRVSTQLPDFLAVHFLDFAGAALFYSQCNESFQSGLSNFAKVLARLNRPIFSDNHTAVHFLNPALTEELPT